MESHLILKISSPILVQFWEKTEAKNTVKTVVELHIVTFWAPGAGIKSPGVNPQTALHLFNVGLSSTLTYGCASIYINKSQLVNLDKYQVKLIKQCLGLKCRTRTTALMKALGIEYISSTIKQSSLDLLKVCLLNNSITQKFYCMLMNEPTVRQVASKTLYGRVSSYCRDKGINLLRYVFSDIYSYEIIRKLKNEHIVNSLKPIPALNGRFPWPIPALPSQQRHENCLDFPLCS